MFNNGKAWLAWSLMFCGVFCGVGFWLHDSNHELRNPASTDGPSVADSPNIKALKAIPLVRGLEKPEADEADITIQLIDIFERFAYHNRNSDGSLNRGTHAKGECFQGQLELFSEAELKHKLDYPESIVARLRKGFFELSGGMPATLRFANADGVGRKQDDRVGDVRGFSFSAETPVSFQKDYLGTHRQDFMMNSTPEFATGGIHDFLEVVKAANIATYHDFTYIPNPLYIPAVAQALKLIQGGDDAGKGIASYAHTEYWGNLPYTQGANDLVKFKTTPCDGQGTQKLSSMDSVGPDYLQTDIVQQASAGSICFYLQLQFFDLQKLRASGLDSKQAAWSESDWVENGGVLWDEKVLPFYTVGRVEVSRESAPISCDDQYINTRLHANPANLPIGSIARVRTLVEETSRARRMGN